MADPCGMVGRFAGYIVEARSRPLDDGCREAALRCLFDLLGAAAAGIREPGPVAVRSAARGLLPGDAATVWFTGERASVAGAAWADAAAAAALDLDDGHRQARGHPGAAVIPAVLAVAEATGADGEAVLNAIAIGYEVGVSIAAARQSYGSTGTWAAYAVVAAAAALRGTPHAQIAHALAIAGESGPNQAFASGPAPRIPAPEGSAVKEGIPWAVVTGLFALGLAEAGHTGPRNILDSERHYRFPPDLVPGAARHVRSPYFKLYACCRHVHAPLDALQSLIDRHAIVADRITAILVETHGGALRISNKTRPANGIEVQYSIPYCLGLLAVHGAASLLPLTDAALDDPRAGAVADTVRLVRDDGFDARFPAETLARVTVACGADRFVSDITTPRGEASSPLTWAELEAKFRAATRRLAQAPQQDALIAAVDRMRAGSTGALLAALAQTRLA